MKTKKEETLRSRFHTYTSNKEAHLRGWFHFPLPNLVGNGGVVGMEALVYILLGLHTFKLFMGWDVNAWVNVWVFFVTVIGNMLLTKYWRKKPLTFTDHSVGYELVWGNKSERAIIELTLGDGDNTILLVLGIPKLCTVYLTMDIATPMWVKLITYKFNSYKDILKTWTFLRNDYPVMTTGFSISKETIHFQFLSPDMDSSHARMFIFSKFWEVADVLHGKLETSSENQPIHGDGNHYVLVPMRIEASGEYGASFNLVRVGLRRIVHTRRRTSDVFYCTEMFIDHTWAKSLIDLSPQDVHAVVFGILQGILERDGHMVPDAPLTKQVDELVKDIYALGDGLANSDFGRPLTYQGKGENSWDQGNRDLCDMSCPSRVSVAQVPEYLQKTLEDLRIKYG